MSMQTKPRSGSANEGSDVGAPRWSLASIYDGFDGEAYRADKEALSKAVASFLKKARNEHSASSKPSSWIKSCLKRINEILDLYENLSSFAYTQYSVNTNDRAALGELNGLEELILPYHEAVVHFRNALASLGKKLPKLESKSKTIRSYSFYLSEQLFLARHQMSAAEEALAADLSRAGGDAWSRLQESVSSNLSVDWENGEQKTVIELRALAYDADRNVRMNAYHKELEAWKSVEIPIAASLNGVKGFSVILNRRRQYESALEEARRQARISDKTLHSLTGAMEDSLPQFRTYLETKASLLNVPKLAFFDLFAPVGGEGKRWSFDEARRFIIEQFTSFSWDLGEFAEQAFEGAWIDGEMRRGKIGGAYCTSFPLARESRVLANFDGSFSSVSTIAHELGHGYHHHVLKDEPAIHREYPMTLAETASIFCEAIVFTKALETFPEQEKISVLESFLQDSTQVIVDILSRYKFESMLFERRGTGEVSPEELCDLMTDAQRQTYGSGLDESALHPYMWAVKPHYYNVGLAFYNFPYAFGQLFGLGLFAQYQEQQASFPERYRELLGLTGKASAEEVTREAGFDIESKDFWKAGLDAIGRRIETLKSLVAGTDSAVAPGEEPPA